MWTKNRRMDMNQQGGEGEYKYPRFGSSCVQEGDEAWNLKGRERNLLCLENSGFGGSGKH